MSALLAHVKAQRALGKAFLAQGERAGDDGDDASDRLLTNMGRAYEAAAVDLEAQMFDECSGDERPPAHAPRKGRS